MTNTEVVETEQLLASFEQLRGSVEIPGVAPVLLQTYDLARHIAIAPNGRCYVVATFDDTRIKRGYVTAVFPQQNGYLTLVRLTVHEQHSQTPEEAVGRHLAMVQIIQQGGLKAFLKSE